MNNITPKQILALLLMGATMVLFLAMMPEQAARQTQTDSSAQIVEQASR